MDFLKNHRTARLILTKMCADDFDDLARMYRDTEVMATLGGIRSAEQTAQHLQQQMAHWEQHGFGWWTAHEPRSGKFVGRGGLRYATLEGQTVVEVGYGLMPEFWGQGLATELACESVRIGFAELSQPEIFSWTLPTNLASRRVMEKAGFHYERDIVYAELPHVLYRQSGPT